MAFLILFGLFLLYLFLGIKIDKTRKQEKAAEVEEVKKEPIKAVKIGGVRVDIKELKEKSSHLCEGLKRIIQVER